MKLKDVAGAAAEVEEAASGASLPRTDVVAPKEKPLAPPKAPPVAAPKGAPKAGGECAPATEEPLPKAGRESAPAKEEPLPKANPVLEPALALAPKAEAGAAPTLPNPPPNALVAAVEDAPPAVAAAPPNAEAPAGAWAKELLLGSWNKLGSWKNLACSCDTSLPLLECAP